MTLPKISVVIPAFNEAKYISQTLDSIFDQKYPNLEVVIQDGGSTDGSVEIIKKYADKYPAVKWESERDKGQGDALNKGFKKARGEILTFINADDIYVKDTFFAVSEAFHKDKSALWFAGKGMVINSQGKEIAKLATWYKNFLLGLNNRFFLLITNYLMQPSVFFSKKAYQNLGPIKAIREGIIEYDFWLKISEITMPVVINQTLSEFRMSGENISSIHFIKTLSADSTVVKKHTENIIILALHDLHNFIRVIFNKLI